MPDLKFQISNHQLELINHKFPTATSRGRSKSARGGRFRLSTRAANLESGCKKPVQIQGNTTLNVLPLPSSLSNEISPPSSLHSSFTIDSPRPVPEYSRVRLSPPC